MSNYWYTIRAIGATLPTSANVTVFTQKYDGPGNGGGNGDNRCGLATTTITMARAMTDVPNDGGPLIAEPKDLVEPRMPTRESYEHTATIIPSTEWAAPHQETLSTPSTRSL